MMDWYLTFTSQRSLTVEQLVRALATVVDGSVTTSYGEEIGNPRDGWVRLVGVQARRGDVQLDWCITQHIESAALNPRLELGELRLIAATRAIETRLAIWRALRDAFALLGCTDRTLQTRGTRILADVEAWGAIALATQLRAEMQEHT